MLEILTGPPVRGQQLWRRTGNFLFFLQVYVYDLRFKAWGPTTFLTEFQTLQPLPESMMTQFIDINVWVTRPHKSFYFYKERGTAPVALLFPSPTQYPHQSKPVYEQEFSNTLLRYLNSKNKIWRQLDSTAAEMLVNFHSSWTTLYTNFFFF